MLTIAAPLVPLPWPWGAQPLGGETRPSGLAFGEYTEKFPKKSMGMNSQALIDSKIAGILFNHIWNSYIIHWIKFIPIWNFIQSWKDSKNCFVYLMRLIYENLFQKCRVPSNCLGVLHCLGGYKFFPTNRKVASSPTSWCPMVSSGVLNAGEP